MPPIQSGVPAGLLGNMTAILHLGQGEGNVAEGYSHPFRRCQSYKVPQLSPPHSLSTGATLHSFPEDFLANSSTQVMSASGLYANTRFKMIILLM